MSTGIGEFRRRMLDEECDCFLAGLQAEGLVAVAVAERARGGTLTAFAARVAAAGALAERALRRGWSW